MDLILGQLPRDQVVPERFECRHVFVDQERQR